jgi:hypothetical protein
VARELHRISGDVPVTRRIVALQLAGKLLPTRVFHKLVASIASFSVLVLAPANKVLVRQLARVLDFVSEQLLVFVRQFKATAAVSDPDLPHRAHDMLLIALRSIEELTDVEAGDRSGSVVEIP